MLALNDIYTSSGSNILYGCWTSDVTKFDTSSFYNWEEDNLPLLDLQERTHLLWERLGHPTSALTGFSFVVSADAPAETCNASIFTTLSSCINKLPEIINAPYLIEVASFGQLGELKLTGKKFGPRGSIEIINRNFAAVEGSTSSLAINRHLTYNGSVDGYASAVILNGSPAYASSHPLYEDIPSLMHGFVYSKCLSTSAYVFSSVGLNVAADARLHNNLTVFSKEIIPMFANKMTAALAVDNDVSAWSNGASGIVKFKPYEYGASIVADEPDIYDASTINDYTNLPVFPDYPSLTDDFGFAATYGYGNRLSKVLIDNCNGPIYIRGFTVDGGGFNGTENGFEIVNSNNIFLERCSAARCTKAGLLSINSNVTLLRGFVGYRNYSYNLDGSRAQVAYASKINSLGLSSTSYREDGAGIRIINSNLSFSSTLNRDEQVYLEEWNTWDSAVRAVFKTPIPATGWMFCLSRNSIGIDSINSNIQGGQREFQSSSQPSINFYNATNLYSEYNTEAGIKLTNSKLAYDGRLITQGNFKGIDMIDSDLEYDILISRYNQKEGIHARNSTIRYNRNVTLPNDGAAAAASEEYRVHHNSFYLNGIHMRLSNSEYLPTECSGMPEVYERFVCTSGFGIYLGKKLPSIIIENNSKARLINASIETPSSLTYADEACYGQAVSVINSAELHLQGTKNYITKIIGPKGVTYQAKKAGLYATDNSTIRISGPTVIARYAVDALAENNSTIAFEPHIVHTGGLDVNGMSLEDPGNHTQVELHSTRACLVVDNGSILSIKDIGDYQTFWTGTNGAASLASGVDYETQAGALNTQMYTSGGFIQFYPNTNEPTFYPPAIDSPTISLYTANTMVSGAYGKYFFDPGQYLGDSTNNYQYSSITTGGICVKATNNSLVDVINAHFPCGWWNPSAVIYDFSGTNFGGPLCSRLFIWNIADNSMLNARYIAVSANHPADVGYHGPSGDWGTSSAPSTTPDTSSVSVLDFYGRSTIHRYGKSTQQNLGPFRLYFSHQPEANWLTPADGTTGFVNQVFAQNYNFSGNTMCPSGVSSAYISLWKANGTGVVPSGFYYANEMLAGPDSIKAVLDDSAANTFANAKHCTVGKSNIPKVVSILNTYTNVYGGDAPDSSTKNVGKGFKSSNGFDLERDN